MRSFLLGIILLILTDLTVADYQCPTPPTAIDPSIQSSYTLDKKTQEYLYTYKITNGPKAKLDIIMLQIESPQDVQVTTLPSKWVKEFQAEGDGYPNNLKFNTSFNLIPPKSQAYTIQFRSKLAPGLTRYYFTSFPKEELKAININNDPEAIPNCPGFYTETDTVLESKITGLVTGPVASNQVEVKLRTKVKKKIIPKNFDDESENPEISSIDKGTMQVILYGAKNLDLSKIDLQSITFGPANAKPTSAKIIGKNFSLPWRILNFLEPKMIFMEFRIEDLQIRCDLDNALFLKAQAGDKKIFGAARMKPVLCNKEIWKQMSIERKWPLFPESGKD